MRSRLWAAALGIAASSCCARPAPAWRGPPPEYEPPRPGPGGAPAPTSATIPPYESAERLAAWVDAYMGSQGARYGAAYAPSGALVVLHAGQPVLARTYGALRHPGGPRPDTSSRFSIAALARPLVAIAVLQLVDEGSVRLDASIRTYVPELPEVYAAVTVHRLLAQSSGIPCFAGPGGLAATADAAPSRADVVAWLAKNPPAEGDTAPHAPSESNDWLLARVVESATKTTIDARVAARIFAPAEMKASGSSAAAGDATGHVRSERDDLVAVEAAAGPLAAAGAVRSSANDLAQLERALRGTIVLGESSKKRMWTPVDGGGPYGWSVEGGEGGAPRLVWHGGAGRGFGAFYGRAPDLDVAVVYLSNVETSGAEAAGLAVLRMAATGKPVPPREERELVATDPRLGESLAGEYVLSAEARDALGKVLPRATVASLEGVALAWDGSILTAKPVGQAAIAFRATRDGRLFSPSTGAEIGDFDMPRVGVGQKGKMRAFTLRQGATAITYVRGKLPTQKK